MDALGRKACGVTRTVKPCGSGSPTLESSLRIGDVGLSARHAAQAMVAKKPGTPGRARSSRKAIAQGVPDRFGEPVVTNACVPHYPFCTQGCGCVERPAFPAPSVLRGTPTMHRPGENAPR